MNRSPGGKVSRAAPSLEYWTGCHLAAYCGTLVIKLEITMETAIKPLMHR
jgi:hypothetical protein